MLMVWRCSRTEVTRKDDKGRRDDAKVRSGRTASDSIIDSSEGGPRVINSKQF